MEIKIQAMGMTQTNCYIVSIDKKDFIIDPGIDATAWVLANVTNPIAILNTHGHFDHVWSNEVLQEKLNIPLYCPKGDTFMLSKCPLGQSVPASTPDYEIIGDETINIQGIPIKYRHFSGHTPGCSIIEIEDVWFSGDFLFQQSIGRWDFPFSNGKEMIQSLEKALVIKENYTIYPGHGLSTTLKEEQRVIPYWIKQVKATL
ncbi:Hydroxyacylglutathione hydrolase [hydrothermal vent metagenome]|uniref:Hydroxyacylglutathione hydrolase n=1 Tax=hydrothermal vent metagenome TaxID=652676 RepID=A0A1W1CHK6_9ZZZZ